VSLDYANECGRLLFALRTVKAGIERGISPAILEHTIDEALREHRERQGQDDPFAALSEVMP
jgi:hypothetical protein